MLSQQSKYALRAVQYLHTTDSGVFLRVEEIARATQLPAPYLAKVLKMLVQQELLLSRRGKNGGVSLVHGRPPLTFIEVCRAVGDPIVQSECVLHKRACSARRPCAFHDRWAATKAKLLEYLEEEEIS
jgi:Rrf2 family iron-sulfur cluster assembly transcriptional regulator